MMGRVETVLGAGAVLLAALFLLGVQDVHPRKAGGEGGQAGAVFHSASPESPEFRDPVCQAAACHDPFPHRKNRGQAAFLNMHRPYADCLACHGKDAKALWSAKGESGSGKGKVGYSSDGRGTERHEGMGPAVACRSCHSAEGRQVLMTKGMSGLPSGFADPLALRMIEGGARSWTPADLR